MKLTIRRARRSDLDRIAVLLAEFTQQAMSQKEIFNRFALVAGDPEQKLLVACDKKAVVGLLAFRIRHNLESVSHYGEVACVAIDSAWRRKGVGRKLMEEAERLARKHKCIGLWLVSGFGRERKAHQFYRQLGFEPTGVRFVKSFTSTEGS